VGGASLSQTPDLYRAEDLSGVPFDEKWSVAWENVAKLNLSTRLNSLKLSLSRPEENPTVGLFNRGLLIDG